MKFSQFTAAFLLAAFTVAPAMARELTDEMALEEGMTPIEEVSTEEMGQYLIDESLRTLEDGSFMDFQRSEYVSTIPSMDDIQRAIKSNRQVIVINKAVKGPGAQTLTVYENGAIKPIIEDGVAKNSVKISTGREKNEKAKSGREYFSTTPKGFFRPQRVYTMYYSNTWKADMPNAIFMCANWDYQCGLAIHATTKSHYAELGTRASGGCVRTKLDVSKQLREMVMQTGKGSREGQYSTLTEGHRRWKVTNNTVSVDNIDRNNGSIVNRKVNSWDTLIVVYE